MLMKNHSVKDEPSRQLNQNPISYPPSDNSRHGGRNVFRLIAQREISPTTKYAPARQRGEASKRKVGSLTGPKSERARDARRGLISWVEAESLRHLSGRYCPLMPPPRSTIAAAFSPDGRTLASTHGDHTVKIIDCETGSCLKVLSGHRRTPWVVRFHPLYPEIVASGSLDHEVRLWDANTSECIGSRDFYRPIASIAFHAKGELLAVASGHKLYIWHYNKRGEPSSPTIILKTRRSLRAVHFHPHAAPFLLTAEVNDIDSSDSSMTQATTLGYLRYPPPAVFVSNVHSGDCLSLTPELPLMSLPLFVPSSNVDDSRRELQQTMQHIGTSSVQMDPSASIQFQTDRHTAEQNDNMLSPMDTSSLVPPCHPGAEGTANNSLLNAMGIGACDVRSDAMEIDEMQSISPGRDHAYWELPFLQGWLMGQSQVGLPSMSSSNGGNFGNSNQHVVSSNLAYHQSTHNLEGVRTSSSRPGGINLSGVSGRSGLQQRFPHIRFSVSESGDGPTSIVLHDGSDAQLIINRIESEISTSLAAAAATELPCTVKLRVWSHDIRNPCAPLNAERCCLTIPHAVLCSEMGAHFSPCGKFLAACVACTLPHGEVDSGLQTPLHQDSGAASSPTRHPISAHQVMYELRIYSLEEATFGSVLVSRAIRAAHCLTSIQFSPTSEHILLAYGRRHGSLLKSVVIDGETTLPIYTVLEVYKVSDMELVRVLPSAEDEVNVACFHPFAGGGLVYGTKEGKLRIFQFGAHEGHCTSRTNNFPEEKRAIVV
ncbi:uncharacterized protein LOC107426465 isoform X2 [Ziziphus jujuba]|uniref:Uncharacterized protein LOC107426465 isoform X2 n=1 Tax=Ziziphus jujuba TaxID=326968 RepID=A0A6P4ASJ6_ZIZJJ|nr:uncharacterized protein LOC107426465 isoform X2 [Ziziphus jujuba]